MESLEFARGVLDTEAYGIKLASATLDGSFTRAMELLEQRTGRIIVMGVGKSGHIGRKIAGTFSSTGQPALFVHPTEAMHGDSGAITPEDTCLMISHSGYTKELFEVLPGIRAKGVPIILLSGNAETGLANWSDAVLETHVLGEACPFNLAPTTSSTVSLALGDALALSLMHARGIGPQEFAQSHPGGNLGRRLMNITDKVDAVTKIGDDRLRMGGLQPPPKSVKIELTARCSLRCRYCAVRTRKGPPAPDMDLDYFKRITTQMRRAGVEEIGLFYLGESFMAPDLLVDACRWVAKDLKFPWVFLTSNAVDADPDVVESLFEAGLHSLKWSCNSYDLEQFKEMCGGTEKQWHAHMSNIKDALGRRNRGNYDTILSASSIQYDPDQKAKMQGFLDDNVISYVDRHYWLPMYSMSMYREKVRKDTGYVSSIGNMGRIDDDTQLPNRSPLPCWAAFTEGHVRADGGLSACCFGSDDRFDMGKLGDDNFMEQWNSDKFVALREAHIATIEEGPIALKDTPCKVCVAWTGGDE